MIGLNGRKQTRMPEFSKLEFERLTKMMMKKKRGRGDFLFSKTVRKASGAHPAPYSKRAEVIYLG